MQFIIKNEGFIYEKEWVYDEEKGEGEYKKTFLNPEKNNDLYLLSCLNYPIELDEGFTVRDWFKLIINYPALQFLDSYFEDYIEEYQKCPENNCVDSEVHEIVIRKTVQLEKFDEKEELFDCEIFDDVYGSSNLKDTPHFGIELWELKNFLDTPIKLMKGIFIRDSWNGKRGEEFKSEVTTEDVNFTYTLYNLVKSLIFELSWFGSPKERNEKGDELSEQVREIKSGEAKTIPLDLDDLFKEKEDKNET